MKKGGNCTKSYTRRNPHSLAFTLRAISRLCSVLGNRIQAEWDSLAGLRSHLGLPEQLEIRREILKRRELHRYKPPNPPTNSFQICTYAV